MKPANIKITGLGHYLPEEILENESIERAFSLASGSIEAQLGVRERRRSPRENNIQMGAKALRAALENAGLHFGDLDLLLHASVSYAYIIPNTATMIQRELGESDSGIPCMDVNQACLSWLAALDMAAGLLELGRYRRIGIVSSEWPSQVLNRENLETWALFGDAAAATIVEKTPSGEPSRLLRTSFKTFSDGWDLSYIPAGGLLNNPRHGQKDLDFTFQMQNRRLLLYSFKRLNEFVETFLKTAPDGCLRCLQTADHIIPHQASRAGLDYFGSQYGVSDKLVRILDWSGNCVAASLPLALSHAVQSGRIRRGERVLFIGTAAGVSVGAAEMIF